MPPKLLTLKEHYRKIGEKKLFGEGTVDEINTSLHRLNNKSPSEKTKDLAKRIIAVVNGHGTDYDILNFKKLVREFQIESQIKIADLFRFLRHTKAPKTLGINTLRVAKLDRNTLQYSEFLDWIEDLAETIEIKSDGKIIKTPGKVNPRNKELLSRFIELKNREEQKAKAWLNKYIGYEESKQILSKEVVLGAVVLVVDSRIKMPNFISFANERGYYKTANKDNPSIIVIDINPNKRTDAIDVKTSLVHELRHCLFDMFRRLMISDSHNPIVSATLNLSSPEIPKGFRSTQELIMMDKVIYEHLLNRSLSSTDIENIKKQRAYLDELHSSVMQRKSNWFMYDKNVYSTEISKGKHFEMVGNNPEDIRAVNNMFCHVQGFYFLDVLVNASKDSRNPWSKVIDQKFKEKIPKYFNRVGSIIATSLTVQQASRLIEDLWKTVIKEFPNIDIKLILSGLNENQKGRPSNGQTIEQFLSI